MSCAPFYHILISFCKAFTESLKELQTGGKPSYKPAAIAGKTLLYGTLGLTLWGVVNAVIKFRNIDQTVSPGSLIDKNKEYTVN